jgi:hypothetical protein
MMVSLPRLLWLPGDFYQIRWTDSDAPSIAQFCESALAHSVASLMIYAEATPLYRICLFTLSTPTLTLLFDAAREQAKRKGRLSLPPDLLATLSDERVTVVCPGQNDWHSSSPSDHLLMLHDVFTALPAFRRLRYVKDYENSLCIQPSGPQLCAHLKMMRWMFQVVIDSQLHGLRLQSSALTMQWRTLTDHYGKMLIFLFWALEEKQRLYDENPAKGLTISPIYLEDLLTRRRIVTDMSVEDLRQKLIGAGRYPNPPLPRLPG